MAKSLSAQLRRAKLKETATKNATTVHKIAGEEPETLKRGIPLDHAVKHNAYEGAKLGMSKGVTKNMDNYESLRVDVWLTDEVQSDESVKEAYTRIESVIDEVLEESVYATAGE